MSRPKKPPTHTLWTQHLEHGRFREWYKSGHLWLEENGQGKPVVCIFQAMHPRGGDGFTWGFPVGEEPPPPQKLPQRPQSGSTDDTDEDQDILD